MLEDKKFALKQARKRMSFEANQGFAKSAFLFGQACERFAYEMGKLAKEMGKVDKNQEIFDEMFGSLPTKDAGAWPRLGVYWKLIEPKGRIMLYTKSIPGMFDLLFRFIIYVIHQYRQFHEPNPEIGSLAYIWTALAFDVSMFWKYKILRQKPEVESEDDILGRGGKK